MMKGLELFHVVSKSSIVQCRPCRMLLDDIPAYSFRVFNGKKAFKRHKIYRFLQRLYIVYYRIWSIL